MKFNIVKIITPTIEGLHILRRIKRRNCDWIMKNIAKSRQIKALIVSALRFIMNSIISDRDLKVRIESNSGK